MSRRITRALQRTAAPLGSWTVRIIWPRLLQPTGRFRRRSLSLVVRSRMRKRHSCVVRIVVWSAVAVLAGFTYVTVYFGSTRLRIGKPMLDWYAYRIFSSRAQFVFFYPMFVWERHYDRGNPGYTLLVDTRGMP